ncbi:MAG: ATP-binding protein [Thermomicrobiales bacterium]
MSFYNRVRELAVLKGAGRSPRAELLILYGRRGVGKSALLAHAFADVRHIFYRATRRTLTLQLDSLTAMAREAYPDEFIPQPFASFEIFLDFLAHLAEVRPREPVVVILDELPYLADVDPGLLTTLQHWWDAHRQQSNLKLLLAGSYLAFMERQVLDANAPLYNRRTGSLKLAPFDYAEAALFFPAYSPRERLEAYAILGGMPSYLEQFDAGRGLEENLLATVLRRNTYLNEEPDWLLLEDLRRDVTHGSILRAIATGQRRPSDIARAIGKASAQDVSAQLGALLDLELIHENDAYRVPLAAACAPVLLAEDHSLLVGRYVDPGRSLIAQGLGERGSHPRLVPRARLAPAVRRGSPPVPLACLRQRHPTCRTGVRHGWHLVGWRSRDRCGRDGRQRHHARRFLQVDELARRAERTARAPGVAGVGPRRAQANPSPLARALLARRLHSGSPRARQYAGAAPAPLHPRRLVH